MHFYLKSETVIMKLIYVKNSAAVLWRSAELFKFKQMTGPLKFKPVHKSLWQACAVLSNVLSFSKVAGMMYVCEM